WYDSVLQGRMAAAMMTGHHEVGAGKPGGLSPLAGILSGGQVTLGVPWHATQLGELCMLSVGHLQDQAENAMIFTDSSKRNYRRLTVMGDRLVSYLSLGSTQPDSLAIKHIIDEGLSIRDITKNLLKGDFDARKYFSQQQSRAARDMVTSGKLPAVNWVLSPV